MAVAIAGWCGTSTYRTGNAVGRFEVRLVATREAEGERAQRFFSDEELTLESRVLLRRRDVREVQLENRPDGERHIVLYLTGRGRRRLARATRENLHRRLAILVDGRVVMAPEILTEISEGIAHIRVGDGDIEEVYEALTRTPTSGGAGTGDGDS